MDEIYIEEGKTILDAMRQLDRSARKVLFVQEKGKLLAAVTDGDIRRWILKNGDLQADLRCVANYDPKFLYEQQEGLAVHTMKEYGIDAMPILDADHLIQKVVFANDPDRSYGRLDPKIPVVIMAGGKGTRLSPYTNILPKPLIPIGDLPIVEHIINRFCIYGCVRFYMIVHYKRNMIKAYFDDLDKRYELCFIEEERTLGTGGGLSLLKGRIRGTFVLTNCDILIEDDLEKAYKHHVGSGNLITMICSLKNFNIPYGVVTVGKDGTVASMQEKPDMSFLTNTGCYFVEPEVIEDMGYDEPVDFPTIIERYIGAGRKVGLYPIGEDAWLDMGQPDGLEKMKMRLG